MPSMFLAQRTCVQKTGLARSHTPVARPISSAQPSCRTHQHGRSTRSTRCRAEPPAVAPKDDLGELAEKIQEVAKSVDEGLQGTSLCLVGMMGSGKSTVGQMIANSLRYCFFDTDAVIEQAAGGATIAEIFADGGEEGFRTIETNVLRELSAYKNCVIATGGGAVVRPENWASMTSSVVIFLDGKPDLLARRICSREGTASRPLLAGGNDKDGGGKESTGKESAGDEEAATTAKLAALLEERTKFYTNADCTVGLAGPGDLGATTAQVAYRVLVSIDQKIKESTAEREARKNYVIKDEGLIPIGEKIADATPDAKKSKGFGA